MSNIERMFIPQKKNNTNNNLESTSSVDNKRSGGIYSVTSVTDYRPDMQDEDNDADIARAMARADRDAAIAARDAASDADRSSRPKVVVRDSKLHRRSPNTYSATSDCPGYSMTSDYHGDKYPGNKDSITSVYPGYSITSEDSAYKYRQGATQNQGATQYQGYPAPINPKPRLSYTPMPNASLCTEDAEMLKQTDTYTGMLKQTDTYTGTKTNGLIQLMKLIGAETYNPRTNTQPDDIQPDDQLEDIIACVDKLGIKINKLCFDDAKKVVDTLFKMITSILTKGNNKQKQKDRTNKLFVIGGGKDSRSDEHVDYNDSDNSIINLLNMITDPNDNNQKSKSINLYGGKPNTDTDDVKRPSFNFIIFMQFVKKTYGITDFKTAPMLAGYILNLYKNLNNIKYVSQDEITKFFMNTKDKYYSMTTHLPLVKLVPKESSKKSSKKKRSKRNTDGSNGNQTDGSDYEKSDGDKMGDKKSGSKGKTKTVDKDKTKTDSKGKTKTDSKGKTKTDSKGKTKTDSKGKTKTDSKGKTKTDSKGKNKD